MNGPIESTFLMIADYRHPRKSVPRTSRISGQDKSLFLDSPNRSPSESIQLSTLLGKSEERKITSQRTSTKKGYWTIVHRRLAKSYDLKRS